MKRIAFVVIIAAVLVYFLVNKRTAKLTKASRAKEDAILSTIPLNAFEGPDIGF